MKAFRLMITSLFAITLFTGCSTNPTTKENKKQNINTDIIENQTIESLSFTNPSLIYENNNSKFQVTVTNTSNEAITLSKILIHVKDIDGNEIVTLEGFVGSSIEANTSKRIDTVYGENLMDAKKIEYEIVK